jgi:hypothetical protein
MLNIGLHVSTQGNAIKLAWDFPELSFSQTYCVNTAALTQASTGTRNVLRTIATAYVNAGATYDAYLPALATAGASLRTALFTSTDNKFRQTLLNFLDARESEARLTIYSDSSIEVPWNFVFVGPAVQFPVACTLADFKDFWLSRFKIRIRFCDGEFPPRKAISQQNVRTLFAIHQSRFKSAIEHLIPLFPDLRDKIDRLLLYRVGTTSDWLDCEAKWEGIKEDDSILYIFAHRDQDGNLCLEEKEKFADTEAFKYELDTNRFNTIFKKKVAESNSNTLCFVNGCRTVDGGWGNSLLNATSASGFQGFIGSEAEISSDWATRYAVEFLYALLEEGKTVDDAYDQVRLLCFPMSLWYSCCAYPGFRIAGD